MSELPTLDGLSHGQLKKLGEELQRKISETRESELVAAVEAVKADLHERGFNIDELIGFVTSRTDNVKPQKALKGPVDKGQKGPPKYRNPENHKETWVGEGRGITSKWLVEKEKAGAKRKDFLNPEWLALHPEYDAIKDPSLKPKAANLIGPGEPTAGG
jgi:DNA-binding protein H-NS